MLNSLYIENIAVIEKTTIEFKEGFNVLTGETGAGKSIIIGAVNSLLGGKITKDMIRSGEEYALVSGSFTVSNQEVTDLLKNYGYELEDNELILQRKFNVSAKSSCRINGRPATLSILKEIAGNLVNIHGQHESYSLMSPEKHIAYIDSMGKTDELKKEYRENLAKLREYKKRLQSAQLEDAQRERQIDLLRYQVNEIEKADLKAGEYEQLIQERTKAQNVQEILKGLSAAENHLNGNDGYGGCISVLKQCSDELNRIAEYLPQSEKLS